MSGFSALLWKKKIIKKTIYTRFKTKKPKYRAKFCGFLLLNCVSLNLLEFTQKLFKKHPN